MFGPDDERKLINKKSSNKEEQQYLDLLKELIDADPKEDRTGVGTNSVFGRQMRFSLEDGKIPLLTTKKVSLKNIINELLFFIRGERDTKILESQGVNIWKGNTTREFLDKRGLHHYKEGDMGPIYGSQLRDFCGSTLREHDHPDSNLQSKGVDQLKYVFDEIKNNPTSRRILMTTLNPLEVDLGVLWPCHGIAIQFNVRSDKLDCLWYQRSTDSAIGLPYNLCSYGLLTHIMAKATGLKAGDLVFSSGDTHLYKTHIDGVKEQISREPYPFPTLKINKDIFSIQDIESLSYEDFELCNYKHHSAIKMEMAI